MATLFDLAAKITLDDKQFQQGINESESKVKSFASKLGGGLKTAAKVGGTAIAAAATGIAALTTKSVQSYAEYEQLVGGVDKLFKDSSKKIQGYAEQAYKTAGMSANDYMETVTGFSASLISSLEGDTEKAADYADRALTDMSDNANTFGTDLESIKYAYQGFAKQNYSMLDNLKLGYGGVKEEMERLIIDASKMTDVQKKLGVTVDDSSMSFGNIVNAISVMQESLGIAGTTAKEAAGTIEGSVNMMKGAWANLLTTLTSGNDLDYAHALDGLIESVEAVIKNVMPRVKETFFGIGRFVEEIGPVITSELPQLVADILPSILDTVLTLFNAVTNELWESAPILIDTANGLLLQLIDWFAQNTPQVLGMGIGLLLTFTQGIVDALPELVAKLPEIITTFIDYFTYNLPIFLEQGFTILETLMFGLLDAIPLLVENLPQIIDSLVDFFVNNFPTIISMGAELIGKLIVGIIGAIPEILSNLPKVVSSIVSGIGKARSELRQTGKYLLEGLWNGINDKVAWLKGKVHGVVDKIKGWFTSKDGFDEHSPSKWSKQVGAYVDEGLGGGIEDGLPEIMRQTKKVTDNVKNGFNDISTVNAGYNISSNGSYGGYGSKTVNYGGINVNVNASDYTSGREFAEELAERLAEIAEEERRAYA